MFHLSKKILSSIIYYINIVKKYINNSHGVSLGCGPTASYNAMQATSYFFTSFSIKCARKVETGKKLRAKISEKCYTGSVRMKQEHEGGAPPTKTKYEAHNINIMN